MYDIHIKESKKKLVATTWLSNFDWLRMEFLKTKCPEGYVGTEYWINLYIGPRRHYWLSTQSETCGRGDRSMLEGWKMAREIMKIVHRDYMDHGDWLALKGSDKRRDDIYFHKLMGTTVSEDSEDQWMLALNYCGNHNIFILYKNYPPEHVDPNGYNGQLQFNYYSWNDPKKFDRLDFDDEYSNYYLDTPEIKIWLDGVWDAIKDKIIYYWKPIKNKVDNSLDMARSFWSRIVKKGNVRKTRRERKK